MSHEWPEYEEARRAAAARRITRRRLLLIGTAASVASVGFASLVASPLLRQGPYPARPDGLRALDDRGYRVFHAVASILLGSAAAADAVMPRVDATLTSLDPSLRRAFLGIPLLLEGSGFVLGGRVKPFSELDPATQRTVLERWAGSRILLCREAVATLRDLIVVPHALGDDGVGEAP